MTIVADIAGRGPLGLGLRSRNTADRVRKFDRFTAKRYIRGVGDRSTARQRLVLHPVHAAVFFALVAVFALEVVELVPERYTRVG